MLIPSASLGCSREATAIAFARAVEINGQPLPLGEYSPWVIERGARAVIRSVRLKPGTTYAVACDSGA